MAQQDQKERNRSIARREQGDVFTDPYRAIRRMFDQFDRWPFGSPASLFGSQRPLLGGWSPQIDSFQRGNEFVVRADLPGLEKKDVTVEVQDGTLIIQGERTSEQEEKNDSYFMTERSYGRFQRVIPLPEGASADSAKATFKNGVLEVAVQAPPQEASRGRKVEISS